MKVFITGASGFVGGAICRSLAGQHQLYAMSRSEASADKARELGAEPVLCQLGEVDEAHLKDIDVVIHAAARVELWGAKKEFWQANVAGTEQLLKVAKQAGVKRFIHIGTEAAMFEGKDLSNIDESYPYALSSPYHYCQTKAFAEKLVLAADCPGFQTVALRPRMIWGPGDQTIVAEVAEMVAKGAFMWIENGQKRTSSTHIDNLVHAVNLAIGSDKHGQAYFILDGEVHSYKQFLTQYLATQGIQLPERSISAKPLMFAASLVENTWRLLGIKSKPPLARLAVSMMSCDFILDGSKAQRELGYQPITSVEQGLATMPKQINQNLGS